MSGLFNSLPGILTLLYPVGVYFGLNHLQPWLIAALLGGLLSLKLLATDQGWSRPAVLCGLVFALFAVWRNDGLLLRFYPVLVNFVMLAIFAGSLLHPPTLIERLARLRTPDLPPQGVLYTRRVTQTWCLFFIANGCLALFTTLRCSFETWSLYNGMIAYLLMAIMFGAEYGIRQHKRWRDV